MKLQEIKTIARNKGIKIVNMKKEDLIRVIQRAEGNSDCFGTAKVNDCLQRRCLWKEDCLTSACSYAFEA